MAEHNYLEIDPKPSIFENLIDSGKEYDEVETDWSIADTEAVISEVRDLCGLSLDVKTIKPTPGICVKTKTNKNEKVFINLCHHIDVPPLSSSVDVEDIILSLEESLFHFPLSLGQLRVEKDKSGHECMCFDAVINSDYYHREVMKKTKIRNFILNLAFCGLEQKYNITTDNGSRKILSKSYHGTLQDHVISVNPQIKENTLPFDENTFMDDIVMPFSKPGIFSSLFDPVTKNNELGKVSLIEDTEVMIPEVNACNKTNIDIMEIQNLFETKTNTPITPKPGLCAKTKTNKNEKVFINLCHHTAVSSPPPSMNIGDIIKGSEELLFHFPLSLGELRVEKDKSGKECKCIDVVINSDYYYHEVSKKTDLCDFILILASSKIERKYNINIDVGAIKILTKPYHGKMPDHFISLLDSPQTNKKVIFDKNIPHDDVVKIQELPETTFTSPKITNYSLFLKPCSDKKASLLIFQSFVTDISDKNDLAVFVSKHQLTVEDKKGNILVNIPLEYTVIPEKSLSNLWEKRLTVAMPVK